MDISIRPYGEGDADALFALMRDWDKDYSFSRGAFDESLKAVLRSPEGELLLAFDSGKIVGYAQTVVCHYLGFEPSLEVIQLLVAADQRSRGIGKRIMAFIEDMARERGLKTVKLHSQVMRSRAHVFYEGLGYEFTKISKFYEKNLED